MTWLLRWCLLFKRAPVVVLEPAGPAADNRRAQNGLESRQRISGNGIDRIAAVQAFQVPASAAGATAPAGKHESNRPGEGAENGLIP